MAKVKFANVVGITFAMLGSVLVLEGMHFAAMNRDLTRENEWLVLRSSVQQGYMLDDAWVNSKCDNGGDVSRFLNCMDILNARIAVSDDLVKVAKEIQKH